MWETNTVNLSKCLQSLAKNIKVYGCVFRKEIWIMDPATDQYYRWLTVIAGPVFYNLMMIVTRYAPLQKHKTELSVM